MKNFKLFLDLIRIKKPIGIMLLFWPCLWGLTLGNNFNDNNLKKDQSYSNQDSKDDWDNADNDW